MFVYKNDYKQLDSDSRMKDTEVDEQNLEPEIIFTIEKIKESESASKDTELEQVEK